MKIKLLILSNLFLVFSLYSDYTLNIHLDKNSAMDEVYVSIADRNKKEVSSNQLLSKKKPLVLTVPTTGPYFLTYIASKTQTIEENPDEGIGEINIFPGKNSAKYSVCIDSDKHKKCPTTIVEKDPKWPNVTLIGEI